MVRSSCCGRFAFAEARATRAATAIQGMAAGCMVKDRLLPGAHCGSILPPRGWERGCRIFLRNVRNRWHWVVSVSTTCSKRYVPKTNRCRMLLTISYWYVWTVLIPRLRGYTLEEQTEVLDDGTSITKLVHSES
jgi:hypothetical protein